MDVKQAFGVVIRRLRHEREASQETVAYRSGLDRSYLSQLENGRKTPSLETAFKIAKALEVAPSDLIARVDRALKENGR